MKTPLLITLLLVVDSRVCRVQRRHRPPKPPLTPRATFALLCSAHPRFDSSGTAARKTSGFASIQLSPSKTCSATEGRGQNGDVVTGTRHLT